MNSTEPQDDDGMGHLPPWQGPAAVFPAPTSGPALLDRYMGCLIGGAIGDALGRPVETWPPDQVRLSYPSGLTDFQPWHGWTAGPKGTFTDDTQLTMVVAEWLIAAGSAAPDGADLAERLCTWLPDARGEGKATRTAVRRLLAGEPWWQAGTPSAGNGAAMRAAPIGLRFAGQAHDMRHAAMGASIPTHKDWTAVASAIVHAAAVGLCLSTTAEALEPQSFLQLLGQSVSDLQLPAEVLRSDPAVRRTLVDQIAEVHHWAGRPTREVFDHFFNGAFVLETIPVVLWSLLEYRDDPERALAEVVMGGRDADTNAAMLGNLLGALHGESVFPQRWRGSDLESASIIRDLARNLYRMRWPESMASSKTARVQDPPSLLTGPST